MPQQHGRLFLLPSPIQEGTVDGIPAEVISLIQRLDHFIVERARTARRFISLTKPLKAIDELSIVEIPENEISNMEIEQALMPLKSGTDIGILSEAGLPCIADPGARYVACAHEWGVEVIPMPGPTSIILALMASGLEGQRFAFHGYLSAKKDELPKQLKDLESRADRDHATQIFMEAPYRNMQVLEAAEKYFSPGRKFCIAAGIGSEGGFVKTKRVSEWRKNGWPEIHKIPAVFLIG